MTEEYINQEIALALGFFDGVHKGHQKLLEKTMVIAEANHWLSGVMTFESHPLKLIFPAYAPKMITTNAQKTAAMKAMGIDRIFINQFTEELMNLSPEAFIRDYLLLKYNVRHLVVGFNYTFGYKGAGMTKDLVDFGSEYGFTVSVMPPCVIGGETVSSTRIRELVATGKVEDVPPLLGRPYAVEGKIVTGKRLGHTFDVPTANLQSNVSVIMPSTGVYFTKVELDGKQYDGLTNLGYNPTFDKHPYSIETYIYDFNQNIYGHHLKVSFLKKIRDEIKFESVDALIARIKHDIHFIDQMYRKK